MLWSGVAIVMAVFALTACEGPSWGDGGGYGYAPASSPTYLYHWEPSRRHHHDDHKRHHHHHQHKADDGKKDHKHHDHHNSGGGGSGGKKAHKKR